ncbi:MAG TPA: hypothetical protein VHM30_15850 [Gemmatimonadaceae bacterium]|nr:hypothetical protein [Gemmatimonadaceae bacterium]
MTALRHELQRAYDAIAVKEVIARVAARRANAALRARERVIRFSGPIFEEVERTHAEGAAVGDDAAQGAAHARLRELLADLILADLRALPRRAGDAPPTIEYELLARWVASTFVVVLDWWRQSATQLPAREANDRFRALVLPALGDVLG